MDLKINPCVNALYSEHELKSKQGLIDPLLPQSRAAGISGAKLIGSEYAWLGN